MPSNKQKSDRRIRNTGHLPNKRISRELRSRQRHFRHIPRLPCTTALLSEPALHVFSIVRTYCGGSAPYATIRSLAEQSPRSLRNQRKAIRLSLAQTGQGLRDRIPTHVCSDIGPRPQRTVPNRQQRLKETGGSPWEQSRKPARQHGPQALLTIAEIWRRMLVGFRRQALL